MNKKFKGFSKEEHAEAAQMLRCLRDMLVQLNNKIFCAYGFSGKVSQKTINPLAFSHLMYALENAYIAEHGGSVEEAPYFRKDSAPSASININVYGDILDHDKLSRELICGIKRIDD